MNKELTKEDKKFLINISLHNRQFLIVSMSLLLAIFLAFTTLIIVIFYNLLVPSKIVRLYAANISVAILLLVVWVLWYALHAILSNYTKKFNEQYQKYFSELYPHLDDNTKFYR